MVRSGYIITGSQEREGRNGDGRRDRDRNKYGKGHEDREMGRNGSGDENGEEGGGERDSENLRSDCRGRVEGARDDDANN